MRYFKSIRDGYLAAIGTGLGGTAITASEYNTLLALIRNKPEPPDNAHGYRITEDGEYVLVEVEPLPEPEPDDSDYAAVGKIFMGVIE